jgi:hypothetical protein
MSIVLSSGNTSVTGNVDVTGGVTPKLPLAADFPNANIREGSNGANTATTYTIFQAAAGETVIIEDLLFYFQNPVAGAGTETIFVTDSADTLIKNIVSRTTGAAMPIGVLQLALSKYVVLSSQEKIRCTITGENRTSTVSVTGFKQ